MSKNMSKGQEGRENLRKLANDDDEDYDPTASPSPPRAIYPRVRGIVPAPPPSPFSWEYSQSQHFEPKPTEYFKPYPRHCLANSRQLSQNHQFADTGHLSFTSDVNFTNSHQQEQFAMTHLQKYLQEKVG